ncbi:FAD-dependent oxidoreductase [Pseudorhodoplanes sinuspersici]|uniref:Glycine oxidase n=1 Tax=Pseudorhodoplanes sinuspersici TaxID=1235591 RepID=A0A1W6ZZC9_9HYPH|nr:FAD-dependent oxidoreductase [Pseudorhodoplanes sinuspersici]ARQ02706.1 glycine oxidase [Pseudorhodoplanes sinuspersici]
MARSSTPSETPVSIVGAGIGGTWQALLFAKAGHPVTVYERSGRDLTQSTSVHAGGMLAPWCEQEAAEPIITRLGARSLSLWREHVPDTVFNGSLVIAHPRDRTDFERFARMTAHHERIHDNRIGELEPALGGRFREALFFAEEGHVEPRRVLPSLHEQLTAHGVAIRFDSTCEPRDLDGLVIDCRGLAAREDVATEAAGNLRGVKGETIIVETNEISLSRPVRLMHPRWPLYVVPRADNRIMIGATSLESEDNGMSVRSALELLSMAYAVHPAFAEARIVEFDSGLRPAYPDNLPRITIEGSQIAVNGLYRHGFLIAPALAEMTLAYVARGAIDNEVIRCN